MGWVTGERQRIPVTVFISVTDVRRALGCSRSLAYIPPAARRGASRGCEAFLESPCTSGRSTQARCCHGAALQAWARR